MAGPNSAPNGDASLVRGYGREEFYFCTICKRVVSKRLDDAKHNRLRTGKTKEN